MNLFFMTNNEREITAYHEAAHVVVAELIGIPVRKVWIYPDDRMGEYSLTPLWFIAPALRGHNVKRMHALVVMAGQAYQEMKYPDSHISKYDSSQLAALRIDEPTLSKIHHNLMDMLTDSKIKGIINAVSHKLNEQGNLSGHEIRKMIC